MEKIEKQLRIEKNRFLAKFLRDFSSEFSRNLLKHFQNTDITNRFRVGVVF